MTNRALISKVRTEPEHAIMHDWWFALIAAAFGSIGFVDEPTVMYRQHSANEVGAKEVNSLSYIVTRSASIIKSPSNANVTRSASIIKSPSNAKQRITATYEQASSFLNSFKDELSEEALKLISEYVSVANANIFTKIHKMNKYGFWKTGLLRKVGQIIYA